MVNYNPQQTYNQYKLRCLGKNKDGEIYGLTIPKKLVEQHNLVNVKFTIEFSDNQLILKSGLDLVQFKKEIDKQKIENY